MAVAIFVSMNAARLGLSLCLLTSSLGTSSANVALPALATDLAAPFSAAQWVVIAHLLALTSTAVGLGRLGDTHGRRRVLRGALALYCAASLGCALAPTLWVLLLARAAQGLGAAGMTALGVATASALTPTASAGRAMGQLGAASSLGTALGPPLGGALMAAASWRWIFVAQFVLAATTFALSSSLPLDRVRRPAGSDRAGAALLALALAAYALATTLDRGRLGAASLALLAVAGLGLLLFVRVERAAATPLVRLSLLGDQALTSGLAASVLVSCVVMTSMVVGPFYLSRALGLSPGAVGLAMAVGSAVAALASLPAGRLVDRLGARRAALVGLAGIAAAALALAQGSEHLGARGYLVPMSALTASYALFGAANTAGVMLRAPPAERGALSGALGLARNLGLVTGACAMGAVFALGAGADDLSAAAPAAVAGGMRSAYALATALALLAFALIATFGRKERTLI